jgi:hypothetical protein
MYRTVQDLPNNADRLTNMFLMYGANITCAPPRFLLYVPGGFDLVKYHQIIDDQIVVQEELPFTRSLHAPIFLTFTLFKDHQLVPDVVAYIDEMLTEKKNTIGPARNRDNSDLKILELEPKKLTQSKLAEMFQFEPASFQRNSELAKNPHMGSLKNTSSSSSSSSSHTT